MSVRRTSTWVTLVWVLAAGAVLAQNGAPPDARAIPRGHGWFCFEDLQPDGSSIFQCGRTQRACDELRTTRVRSGERAGQCGAFAGPAHCFTYLDDLVGHGTRRAYCAREAPGCSAMRNRLEASTREQPVYRNISVCAAQP